MEYNFEVLGQQYAIVASFVQHLAYARGIRAARVPLTEHREFWESTASAHLGQATGEWCKVFGSYGEKTHWKKLVAAAGEQAFEEFRRRILSQTGFTAPHWEDYHNKMLSLRNTFVAHRDLRKPFSEPIPIFDAALQVAYAYQEWVEWLLMKALPEMSLPETWSKPPYIFISQYETWKAEAFSIAGPQ